MDPMKSSSTNPPVIHVGGLRIRVLAGAIETGRLLVADVEAVRGTKVPAHVHEHEDLRLLTLSGTLDVICDGVRQRLGANETVLLARGTPRALEVVSEQARFLAVFDPSCEQLLHALAASNPDAAPLLDDDVSALLAGAGVTRL
jgi:quercetin dioxygenase-like cupin family protein